MSRLPWMRAVPCGVRLLAPLLRRERFSGVKMEGTVASTVGLDVDQHDRGISVTVVVQHASDQARRHLGGGRCEKVSVDLDVLPSKIFGHRKFLSFQRRCAGCAAPMRRTLCGIRHNVK
jgi:hypothetical protein